MQVITKIFLVYFLYTINKFPYLYMAKKKKAGRPEVKDKKLPYPIRLKGSLLEKIKEVAEDNNRSLNGEITQALEEKYL